MSVPPQPSAGPGRHYRPAFGFLVTVAGTDGTPAATVDAMFQEVAGIDPKVDLQEVTEGGLNTYVHHLPGQTGHPSNLQLKRGYVTQGSALAQWAEQSVGSTLGTPIEVRQITVSLLGPDQQPLVNWVFDKVWPVKWEVGPFDLKGDMILTQVLEIGYASVTSTVAAKG